jgi:hypothetical protein
VRSSGCGRGGDAGQPEPGQVIARLLTDALPYYVLRADSRPAFRGLSRKRISQSQVVFLQAGMAMGAFALEPSDLSLKTVRVMA